MIDCKNSSPYSIAVKSLLLLEEDLISHIRTVNFKEMMTRPLPLVLFLLSIHK